MRKRNWIVLKMFAFAETRQQNKAILLSYYVFHSSRHTFCLFQIRIQTVCVYLLLRALRIRFSICNKTTSQRQNVKLFNLYKWIIFHSERFVKFKCFHPKMLCSFTVRHLWRFKTLWCISVELHIETMELSMKSASRYNFKKRKERQENKLYGSLDSKHKRCESRGSNGMHQRKCPSQSRIKRKRPLYINYTKQQRNKNQTQYCSTFYDKNDDALWESMRST